MKRDLNWLKTKADIRIGCFDMVSMGYAIEMYNEDQAHIEKLEKEIASLKEQLVEREHGIKSWEKLYTEKIDELGYDKIHLGLACKQRDAIIKILQTELLREQKCTDFYANKKNINQMCNGTGDDYEEIDGVFHGGKLARATQARREK